MGLTFKFNSRPYSGSTFRPRPEVHIDPSSNLLLVATPWGQRSSARKAIDTILEYYALANSDHEVTSPFERLTCLSTAANNLRTATLLANELLYREENKAEYRSGVEIFGASFVDSEFVWLQVGQPQILLARAGERLMPLGGYVDLSLDMSESNELLPALPNQLLGLDSTVNLTMNSFRAKPGDRIILMSHSSPPPALYGMTRDELSLDQISGMLAKANPDMAFWIGLLDLQQTASAFLDADSEVSA